MEILLLLILLLLAYAMIKLKFLFVPFAKGMLNLPVKELKGKFCQTDFLILPSSTRSNLNFQYEVSQKGLSTQLEVEPLANFDSTGKKIYLPSTLELRKCEFFQNQSFGSDGVVAWYKNMSNITIKGFIDLSPEAFDVVIQELRNNNPVILRIQSKQVRKTDDYVSNSFSIWPDSTSSTPDYFIKNFKKQFQELNSENQENLQMFADEISYYLRDKKEVATK
jgi:hypothetical protein